LTHELIDGPAKHSPFYARPELLLALAEYLLTMLHAGLEAHAQQRFFPRISLA
jgi:hypothetical protein